MAELLLEGSFDDSAEVAFMGQLSKVVAAQPQRFGLHMADELSFLETSHEVAGFFISVLSVIYAVLRGFVILVVWSDFEEIKEAVVREATQLGDILQVAQGFLSAVHMLRHLTACMPVVTRYRD